MGRAVPNAFTLIELLVVIAIMAVIGVYTFANYRSFGEDQNLKNAILDLQSQLRTAQTNATSNVICNTQYGATWQVEYQSDKQTVNLRCQEAQSSPPPIFTKKTLTLGANIEIQSVSGSSGCPTALPFTISFAPLNSQITLEGANCTSLTLILRNTKTGNTKAFTIEQGGRIYAQ